MIACDIPKRLLNAKPIASLRGNLPSLALLIRSTAIGAGRVVVCAVGADVHVLGRQRGLAKVVEEKAVDTVVGIYDQRATRNSILEDLRFAAANLGETP